MDDDRFEDRHWDACADEYEAEQARLIAADLFALELPGLDRHTADALIAECADEFVVGEHIDVMLDGDGGAELAATAVGEELVRRAALRWRQDRLRQPKPRVVVRFASCRPQKAARRVRPVRQRSTGGTRASPGRLDGSDLEPPPDRQLAPALRGVVP
jgi:hypothetical protein